MKKLFAMLFVAMLIWSVSTFAIELETVEVSAEFAENGDVARLTDVLSAPIAYDENKGELFLEWTFDNLTAGKTGADALASYTMTPTNAYSLTGSGYWGFKYGGASAWGGAPVNNTTGIVTDPVTDGGHKNVLRLTKSANAGTGIVGADSFHFQLSAFDGKFPYLNKRGTYTFEYDYYTAQAQCVIALFPAFGGVQGDAYATTNHWTTSAFTLSGKTLSASSVGNDITIGLCGKYGKANAYDIYLDNIRVYFKEDEDEVYFKVGEETVTVSVSTATVTVPTIDELNAMTGKSFSAENFMGWISSDGHSYKTGMTVPASDVIGRTLTAFYQEASLPAMGFAYEADGTNYNFHSYAGTAGTYDHKADGGRTVTVYNQKALTQTKINFHAGYKNEINSNEYTELEMSYKIHATKAGAAVAAPTTKFWYFLKKGIFYDWTANADPYGEFRLANSYTLNGDGAYHTFRLSLDKEASTNAKSAYTRTGKNYGIILEPQADIDDFNLYVDYLRVYRSGITTVTYDTNAPVGYEELVLSEVAPDTGRGLGTGYLLSGMQPAIEELTFMGWATAPDATVEEVVESIDLVGDTTVYAVWVDSSFVTPTSLAKYSIRTKTPTGIRFAALMDLTADTGNTDWVSLARVVPEEYGFIISRRALLGESELNFGSGPDENGSGTTSDGVRYVSGAAFKREGNTVIKDIVYDIDGSRLPEVVEGQNKAFTAVVSNIPDTMYDDIIVARPYIRIGGQYFYGLAREASLTSVATEMDKAYDTLPQAEKDIVDKILGRKGA